MKRGTYSVRDMSEQELQENTMRVDDARLGTQRMKEVGSLLKQKKKKK